MKGSSQPRQERTTCSKLQKTHRPSQTDIQRCPADWRQKCLRTANTTPRLPKPHLQPPLPLLDAIHFFLSLHPCAFFENLSLFRSITNSRTPHTTTTKEPLRAGVFRRVPGNVAFLADMCVLPWSCTRTCVRVLQSFSQCFYPAWCPASRPPCPLLRHHSGCHGRVDVG